MDADQIVIGEQIAPAEVAFLDQQINAFNIATTGIDDARLLSGLLRDDQGAIVAGVFGWSWGGACEIRSLWVAEAQRGHGLGSALLLAAEREALRRGCRQVVLDTHSFQAPLFYQRHGYQIVGVVADYPHGHQKIYLRKALDEESVRQR